MKIAFVLSKASHYFFFDGVIRLLYSLGHDVQIICRPGFTSDGNKSGRALLHLINEEPRARLEDGLFRQKGAGFAVLIRELANYANFMRPAHPMIEWEPVYMRNRLPTRVYRLIKSSLGRFVFSMQATRWVLRTIESFIPPEPKIEDWLTENQPQVVVVSPYILSADLEIEYVKAAHALNIPTIACVLSWDNLVSKGTYLVRPQWLFVWNQNLTEEARRIHEFDHNSIFVSGAPVYDAWFELKPSSSRHTFCRQFGLDADKPYLLYLGSSPTITDLDVQLIKAIILHFEQLSVDARPSVVIRPHPYSSFDMTIFENDWIKVFPTHGHRPDVDDARQTYHDTLFYSSLAVGINTTGFLDAAIVDKPCVTLVDSKMREGQGAHFQYLINADFIEAAKDYSELFEIVDRITLGVDVKKEKRREFVRQFIRPQGIEVSSSLVTAKAIIAVARGNNPGEWMRDVDE